MSKIDKVYQNGEVLYADDINQVVNAVNDNADKIAENKEDIQENERAIQTNAEAIQQQGQTLTQHGNTIQQQGQAIVIIQEKDGQQDHTIQQQGQAIVIIQEKDGQQDHTIQQQGEAITLLQQTIQQQGEALNGIAQRIGEITAAGYSLVGVISTDINPPAPASGLKVYYIALTGTYTHFGASSMVVPEGAFGLIMYDESWSLELIPTGDAAFINVNKCNSQSAAYASAAAARAAVPAGLRKLGLQITYLLDAGWMSDQYVGSDVADWGVADNWQTTGPVSVSQNSSTKHTEIHIGNDDYPVPSTIEVGTPITNSATESSGSVDCKINIELSAGEKIYCKTFITNDAADAILRVHYKDGTMSPNVTKKNGETYYMTLDKDADYVQFVRFVTAKTGTYTLVLYTGLYADYCHGIEQLANQTTQSLSLITASILNIEHYVDGNTADINTIKGLLPTKEEEEDSEFYTVEKGLYNVNGQYVNQDNRFRHAPILAEDLISASAAEGYQIYIWGNDEGLNNPINAVSSGWVSSFDFTNYQYDYVFIVGRRADEGDITDADNLDEILTITKYVDAPDMAASKSSVDALTIDVNKLKSAVIVVDVNGNGNYTSLQDAIDNAGDDATHPKTIIVLPGTYIMSAYDETTRYKGNNRYLSIVGTDKHNCIIRNDKGYYNTNPYYDNSTIKMQGNVYLANLTIINTDDNYEYPEGITPEVAATMHKAYSVHFDFTAPAGTICEIHNCVLINDHFACVGCGNKGKLIFTDCDFKLTTYDVNSKRGCIYTHDANGSQFNNTELIVKDCVLESDYYCIYATNAYGNTMKLTFINNVAVNESGSIINNLSEYFVKTNKCFGNNDNLLNYQ